jgi:hypothetical protein
MDRGDLVHELLQAGDLFLGVTPEGFGDFEVAARNRNLHRQAPRKTEWMPD